MIAKISSKFDPHLYPEVIVNGSSQLLQLLPHQFRTSPYHPAPALTLSLHLQRRRSPTTRHSQTPPFSRLAFPTVFPTAPHRHQTLSPRSRRTRLPHGGDPSHYPANCLLPPLLLHNHHSPAPPPEDHQAKSPPRAAARAIQEQHDPAQSAQDPAAGAASLHPQALQVTSPLLRPQMAPDEHARHHGDLPALQARAA